MFEADMAQPAAAAAPVATGGSGGSFDSGDASAGGRGIQRACDDRFLDVFLKDHMHGAQPCVAQVMASWRIFPFLMGTPWYCAYRDDATSHCGGRCVGGLPMVVARGLMLARRMVRQVCVIA